jgi:prolyl 4-hydroxylase
MTRSDRKSVPEPGDNLVVSIDQFLPVPLCRQMVEVANSGLWLPSTVQSSDGSLTQKTSATTGRNSSTLMAADLGPCIVQELRKLEQSLKQVFGILSVNLEPWQLTRYQRGEAFDYHLDCGSWKNHPSGERRRTIIIYLQEPLLGGSTHFRALNVKISPIVGRLLLWHNLLPNGNCNHAMIHCSEPVGQGCKIVLTTWEHEAPYSRDEGEDGLAMTEEEKVIKEIIERYGEEINMKKTPYVIVEIIRAFGGRLGSGMARAACNPPGGPPERKRE